MAVHLTRIYTRTGDDGSTGLSDFSRVPKTDPRVVAYADCDEANATIGLALALGGEVPDDIRAVLTTVQNDLFDAGADLSTPVVEDPQYPPLRIAQDYIDALERWCDAFGAELPALDSFILPGGTPLAALLHQARTVTRRAERSAWAAVSAHPDDTSVLPAKYLNRLSDLLFILSRVANRTRPTAGGDQQGADSPGDVKWVPGGSRQRPASKSES
ncbi:cob(I)yrinic acid a,c-diamide adenosyltransferase [Gordonia terrae]|uniref:Corrinoid adenosyltransferase n=2 Tax=Gordonia terrae TaxID=2055 RepID=A0AAD0K6V9_9ACTN|nr:MULTISPECIES: cob(I)yrinic acid a,c-diamide adenosyltransferase [Gordonia]VTR09989.1 ATP:cob(I)alamin adenosyltransferase [Clostridioides difficile]ANY23092.1 ATP:cob(I)alamin adenosyltransferase [Gordonia terrae]AWO83821.1 cob(I)yrinic acid a,c-diamide adenosyltransferase [Gordonia terrae]VTS47858.1 Cob(I)yrinic acid a,c-diamide adenosyltransferase [Gordonia terrae]GAB44405.1 putative PduO-type ATP--cob(I)alamin adenosyltransferase [Gordonia terrae NBRC 100016]